MRKRKRESLHNNEVRVLDTTNWIPFVAKPLKFALDYFEHSNCERFAFKQTNTHTTMIFCDKLLPTLVGVLNLRPKA